MKYVQFIIAGIFFYFATLQFNDPDAIAWVLIYSFIGFITTMTALGEKRPYFSYALVLGLLFSSIATAMYIPGLLEWVEAGSPNLFIPWVEMSPVIEHIREFFGLVLGSVTLGYNLSVHLNRTKLLGPLRERRLVAE